MYRLPPSFFFKKEITTIFGASRKHMQMQSLDTVPQQASGHDRCTRKSNAVQVRSLMRGPRDQPADDPMQGILWSIVGQMGLARRAGTSTGRKSTAREQSRAWVMPGPVPCLGRDRGTRPEHSMARLGRWHGAARTHETNMASFMPFRVILVIE